MTSAGRCARQSAGERMDSANAILETLRAEADVSAEIINFPLMRVLDVYEVCFNLEFAPATSYGIGILRRSSLTRCPPLRSESRAPGIVRLANSWPRLALSSLATGQNEPGANRTGYDYFLRISASKVMRSLSASGAEATSLSRPAAYVFSCAVFLPSMARSIAAAFSTVSTSSRTS